MRFKTGRKVEFMNKEVPLSLRKISRNDDVEPSFYIKIRKNDARLKKSKGASSFGVSRLKVKKVKLCEKDYSQSQRHSSEKSDNWRHASLASKGSKQDSGSVAFQLQKAEGHSACPFVTDKIVCCRLALI